MDLSHVTFVPQLGAYNRIGVWKIGTRVSAELCKHLYLEETKGARSFVTA